MSVDKLFIMFIQEISIKNFTMPATSMMSMMAGGDYKTIIITTDENKDSIVNITVYASLT